MSKETKLKVVSTPEAETNQRKALYTILAQEEEYNDIATFVDVDTQIAENLSAELAHVFDGKTSASPKNVMAVLQLDLQGYPVAKIAQKMSMKDSQIAHIKATDSYRIAKEEVLRQVVQGARKYMEIASIKAVKTLLTCLDSSNEKIKLSAAQDILNRSGLQAPQQIEITSNVNNFEGFTTEQLEEMLKKEAIIPRRSEVIEVGAHTIHEG